MFGNQRVVEETMTSVTYYTTTKLLKQVYGTGIG